MPNSLQLQTKSVSVIVVALSSPVLVGIYHDNKLIEEIKTQERSSEVLPDIFKNILKSYNIENLIYAKGPGSFMSIKVTYLFLKTIAIVNNINFLATDAFYFNKNMPIKAVGKLYFVKTSQEIKTEMFIDAPNSIFELPIKLHLEDFEEDTAPAYEIGAV